MTAAEAAAQLAQMPAPQRWKLAVEVFEQSTDILQTLEGKSKASFVIAATEGKTDEGQTVNIRVRSGFYGEGRKGTELFTDDSHFEKRKGSSYKVLFGPHRHGSSYQRGVAVAQGIEVDLANGTPEELGKWMGRKKCEEGLMTLRERTPDTNRFWAGGKSLHTLTSSDVWDRNTAIIANGALKRYGGGLANAGSLLDGRVLMRSLAIVPSTGITRLKLDPAYQEALHTARERGKGNPLFTDEVVDLDNMVMREYLGLDHDGDGPIGSVLEPRGILGTAITAGTGVFNVEFGDKTAGVLYSKWFPGYNYEFTEDDFLGTPADSTLGAPDYIHGSAGTTENIATGGEHYLMIVNPPYTGPAGEPANAVGFYSYTIGNDGNKIAITGRLGSAAGGSSGAYRGRVTTLGSATAPGYADSVTWGAGTYMGATLTDAHPVGALVLPCNIRGVPFGYVPVLGGGGLLRAYGMVRNHRATEKSEGGFLTKVFIESDFGHRIRVDRNGRSPGVQLVGVALSDPSLAGIIPAVA